MYFTLIEVGAAGFFAAAPRKSFKAVNDCPSISNNVCGGDGGFVPKNIVLPVNACEPMEPEAAIRKNSKRPIFRVNKSVRYFSCMRLSPFLITCNLYEY